MRIVQLSAALLLLPIGGLSAPLTFTGSLRFVSPTTITVRLSDGVVIDARLPQKGELTAEKISAQFKLADQVQINCKNIQGGWDESVKRYHSLELTRIQFVRAPSAGEIAQVAASLSWQVGDNLLKPVPEAPRPPKTPDPEGLERVREVNLARAAKMPNFVADEVAVRSVRAKGNSKWKQDDTVESEVAFKGAEDARQHIRINGKPYTTTTAGFPVSTGASDSAPTLTRFLIGIAPTRSSWRDMKCCGASRSRCIASNPPKMDASATESWDIGNTMPRGLEESWLKIWAAT